MVSKYQFLSHQILLHITGSDTEQYAGQELLTEAEPGEKEHSSIFVEWIEYWD